MNFHVGQRVVCVDPAEDLVKDDIYTVTRVGTGLAGAAMIDVAESSGWCQFMPAFFARRFRPIVERKTDIAIFTAMLTGKKVEVGA